jgi:hypothetical protein
VKSSGRSGFSSSGRLFFSAATLFTSVTCATLTQFAAVSLRCQSDVLVVARRRKVLALDRAYPRIEDSDARLALELPDFGRRQLSGAGKLLRCFASRNIRTRFEALLRRLLPNRDRVTSLGGRLCAPNSEAGSPQNSVCFVVSSPLTPKLFLVHQIAALSRVYRLACVANCGDPAWLRQRGIQVPLLDVRIERRPSPTHDLRALWAPQRYFRTKVQCSGSWFARSAAMYQFEVAELETGPQ